MSVIVSDGMSIDQALKLLWREANRENIPNEIKRTQYRIKSTEKRHTIKRELKKRKRRARTAKRRLRLKGQRRALLAK